MSQDTALDDAILPADQLQHWTETEVNAFFYDGSDENRTEDRDAQPDDIVSYDSAEEHNSTDLAALAEMPRIDEQLEGFDAAAGDDDGDDDLPDTVEILDQEQEHQDEVDEAEEQGTEVFDASASSPEVNDQLRLDNEIHRTPVTTAMKRKHDALDHVDVTQETSAENSPTPQEHEQLNLNEQDEEHNDEQGIEPIDPALMSSSPPPARLSSLSPQVEHEAPDTDPTSPAIISPTPSSPARASQAQTNSTSARPLSPARSEPRQSPRPPSPRRIPKMSNAPPNYAPVKTRSNARKSADGKSKGKTKKDRPRAPSAKKEPRTRPPALTPSLPSPTSSTDTINDQLDDDDARKLWCICRRPAADYRMIACDAEGGCRNRWFHFKCVGLARAPKGEWFCPQHSSGAARGAHKRPVDGIARPVKRQRRSR